MFTFLLVVQALIAASLVGVILMQQSEGGGLGMGGSPTGLMSARGAANFLTKATAYLALTFVGLSIALAVVATQKAAPTTIDTSLARKPLPSAPAAPAPVVPLSGDPAAAPAPATTPVQTPAPAPVVPMAAARPKVEPAQPQTRQRAEPQTTRPANPAPPPVAPTVTPSIPKAAPAPQPAATPTTQGPPAENK